ncbi:hypothetical protein HYPSUDRAFT_204376 [Hypholoma sublateritium FD-334 SS-4]|uniref:Uncharacterized protein n=1 Tax=Hypholoma sublateritium (strain FD-334 SS-4) TaxID=945553 RepID=A0A0D2M8K5_HYPSF|nr:hypothetical protein HYPSUDRAFT_204376 [Hypholoma sublateritium FD-334 SS-4]
MENKLLRGGIIALDKISKQLPAHTGHLAIVSTPHGPRRSVISRLYANTRNGERFLGLLTFTLDERAPEYTSAEDCCGRAGDLRGTYLSKLQDRLKKIGPHAPALVLSSPVPSQPPSSTTCTPQISTGGGDDSHPRQTGCAVGLSLQAKGAGILNKCKKRKPFSRTCYIAHPPYLRRSSVIESRMWRCGRWLWLVDGRCEDIVDTVRTERRWWRCGGVWSEGCGKEWMHEKRHLGERGACADANALFHGADEQEKALAQAPKLVRAPGGSTLPSRAMYCLMVFALPIPRKTMALNWD